MRFNAVVLYSRKRLTGWDLNPRAQLINTPIQILFISSLKGQIWKEKSCLKILSAPLPNQTFRSARVSAIHISLHLKCQLTHNYRDCATLALVYSIYDHTHRLRMDHNGAVNIFIE